MVEKKPKLTLKKNPQNHIKLVKLISLIFSKILKVLLYAL